jgi:hypothetical protein
LVEGFDRCRKARGGKMKKELLKGITMLMLVVMLALATAVASANAQSANSDNKVVAADIPFEFSVGYKTMAAGEYQVRTITSANDALMIQSADAKVTALRQSEATAKMKNNNHARLVFHRYGERYFLAEVWNGADPTGRQLLKSQEERAIESELASTASQGGTGNNTFEIVEVLALNRIAMNR